MRRSASGNRGAWGLAGATMGAATHKAVAGVRSRARPLGRLECGAVRQAWEPSVVAAQSACCGCVSRDAHGVVRCTLRVCTARRTGVALCGIQ